MFVDSFVQIKDLLDIRTKNLLRRKLMSVHKLCCEEAQDKKSKSVVLIFYNYNVHMMLYLDNVELLV